jgi:hypothetical protein
MIDVVILSDAKTPELKQVTENCLYSLFASEEIEFNVIVMESNSEVKYENTTTVHLDTPFNYNGFVNYAVLNFGKNPYICYCNNDVLFTKGWASTLIEMMAKYKADSCSPYCYNTFGNKFLPEAIKGTEVRKQLLGWCIFLKRETFLT